MEKLQLSAFINSHAIWLYCFYPMDYVRFLTALGKCYLNAKWFQNQVLIKVRAWRDQTFLGCWWNADSRTLTPLCLIRIRNTGPKDCILNELSVWLSFLIKVWESVPKPQIRSKPRESWTFLPLKKKIKSTVKRVWPLYHSLNLPENSVYRSCNQTRKEKAVIGEVFAQPAELVEWDQ